MKKSGISPLIATVILVGFAVALGALVSTIVIKQAKSFDPNSFVEESPYCDGLVIEPIVVNLASPVTPWPKSTEKNCGAAVNDGDAATLDVVDPYNANLASCSGAAYHCPGEDLNAASFCLLQGIGFKNKGSFSMHSLLVNGPGISNQVMSPLTVDGHFGSKVGPGKMWGFVSDPPSDNIDLRNPAIPYDPLEATVSNHVIKFTPQVIDVEKTTDQTKPVVVPCAKEEFSVDLKTVCPSCYCNCPSADTSIANTCAAC